MRKFTFLFLTVLISSTLFGQSVPGKISYQGILFEDNFPFTGQKTFTFTVGEWTETHTDVEITDGRYLVQLGSIKAFTANVFKGKTNIALKISVGGEDFSPDVDLLTVPYAFVAQKAFNSDSLGGKSAEEVIDVIGEFKILGSRDGLSLPRTIVWSKVFEEASYKLFRNNTLFKEFSDNKTFSLTDNEFLDGDVSYFIEAIANNQVSMTSKIVSFKNTNFTTFNEPNYFGSGQDGIYEGGDLERGRVYEFEELHIQQDMHFTDGGVTIVYVDGDFTIDPGIRVFLDPCSTSENLGIVSILDNQFDTSTSEGTLGKGGNGGSNVNNIPAGFGSSGFLGTGGAGGNWNLTVTPNILFNPRNGINGGGGGGAPGSNGNGTPTSGGRGGGSGIVKWMNTIIFVVKGNVKIGLSATIFGNGFDGTIGENGEKGKNTSGRSTNDRAGSGGGGGAGAPGSDGSKIIFLYKGTYDNEGIVNISFGAGGAGGLGGERGENPVFQSNGGSSGSRGTSGGNGINGEFKIIKLIN